MKPLQACALRVNRSQLADYLDACASAVSKCSFDENHELANSLCESVKLQLGATLNKSQQSQFERIEASSAEAEEAYTKYQAALQVLKGLPDDPDANQKRRTT